MGLITTNTVCESDTRFTGLDYIFSQKGLIYRANRDSSWSGSANVRVSEIFICKRNYLGKIILDSKTVSTINTNLREKTTDWQPKELLTNSAKSFKGVDFGGKGFLISAEEKNKIITEDPIESQYIWPVINASIVTSYPNQIGNDFIINFSGMTLQKASEAKQCIQIIRGKVLSIRENAKRKSRREKWWLYNEECSGLYKAISTCKRVLVNPVVAKYITFSFLPTRIVFTNAVNVYPLQSYSIFTCLQSGIHEFWALQEGSTLETRPRYNPTDCFETFPFPDLNSTTQQQLEAIGENYYNHRQKIMTETQLGLTKTYNRFHDPNETDPEIEKLRQLHIEMDNAVAAAYGWEDLIAPLSKGGWGDKGLNHDFHQTKQGLRFTISEQNRREILDRLLQLNHQRYAEEVKQGLHDKTKKKASKAKKSTSKDQLDLKF